MVGGASLRWAMMMVGAAWPDVPIRVGVDVGGSVITATTTMTFMKRSAVRFFSMISSMLLPLSATSGLLFGKMPNI